MTGPEEEALPRGNTTKLDAHRRKLPKEVTLVLATLAAVVTTGAQVQGYPTRPITMIVPLPCGWPNRRDRPHRGRAHAAHAESPDRD